MKKFYFYNCMLAMMFAGALSLSSCGDDNSGTDDPDVPDQPITPDKPSEENAMSPTDQKERMDNIAQEFMSMTPASDFKSYADLSNYVNETYNEDYYDWDNVSDWARNCWEAARKATGNKITKRYGDYALEIYTEYAALALASNFTGHFRANNGAWVKESGKANDLQFTFTDQNAQTCVLKLETGGNVKKVYVANFDEWQDSEDMSDYDAGVYMWYYYYDRTKCTIGVPENIVLTLTQNGTQIVKTTVNIDLASLSGENFDVSKDNVTASAVIEMSNGYRFNLSQVAYSGNQKASASYGMSKNGTKLATVSIASDVSGIPSCNVEAFSKDDFDFDDYNTDNATAKNALVKIDILGKLQLQGVVKDVRKYSEYMDKAYDNETNENKFKQWVNSANELTQINLFYDNTSVKQAEMKLEAFADYDWGGYTYWEMEPVLVFFDGSSNSMFDVFFNDTDFKQTINAFEDLIDRYENLIK